MSRRAKRALITLRTSEGGIFPCEISPGLPLVIGRGSDTGLRLDTKSVSRQHCMVELDEESGALQLVDLGSQNGTRLNGERVGRALLRTGDVIEIGLVRLDLEIQRSREGRDPTPSPAPSPLGIASPLPRSLAALAASEPDERLRAALATLGLEVGERIDLGGAVPAYLAKRVDLDQDVVVKAVREADATETDDPVSAAEAAQRLLREARLAAKVRHRNVVQIYDVRQAEGVTAVIYERAHGRTLAQEIQRTGPLRPARALEIGIEVARALEHAHGLGVIHRNITPATIMIAPQGEVKIVDLGLAKAVAGAAAKGPALTSPGRSLGMAQYAPPEQARDAASVDARADVYAVGATLYHAMAGEPPLIYVDPLAPDDPDRDVPAPLHEVAPRVPGAAVSVVERAMRARPSERYGSALELRRALEFALAEVEAEARRFDATATNRIDVVPMDPDDGDATPVPEATAYTGRINADELIELLQMLEVNGKTGTLDVQGTVAGGARILTGTICFRDGRITRASSSNGRKSEAALFDLLLLPSGAFRVVYEDPGAADDDEPEPLHISSTLMDALRRRDESTRQRRKGDDE